MLQWKLQTLIEHSRLNEISLIIYNLNNFNSQHENKLIDKQILAAFCLLSGQFYVTTNYPSGVAAVVITG